jgi:ATP-binding cassette subfamily B protein
MTGFINSYFSMLAAIAVILALRQRDAATISSSPWASAWSPICAGMSSSHVMKLSAAFYRYQPCSGEIVSRLTADTTQIKSTVGATASLALRNTILCIGALA